MSLDGPLHTALPGFGRLGSVGKLAASGHEASVGSVSATGNTAASEPFELTE